MNLFFDCEFTGSHKNTTLISLGIVSEDGRKFYAEFEDYNEDQCDEWIDNNVIDNLRIYPVYWHSKVEEQIKALKEKGWKIYSKPIMVREDSPFIHFVAYTADDGTREVCGAKWWIANELKGWIQQFDSVQFVSDVCHYDFVLLIDLFGTVWDLPANVNPSCHDINQDIATYYGIFEKEAFDRNRELIVMELCGEKVDGNKHNALYDAKVIKKIYECIQRNKEIEDE